MSARLTYASLPIEIKKIGNSALGMGFLKTLFLDSHTYHLMIKISDGIFIGFVLYHFENSRTQKGKIVGVIDCVCVSPAYRKEGFGTLLTFGALRKMSAFGADRVEITLKAPNAGQRDGESGIPLAGSEGILRQFGFHFVSVAEDRWVIKSKRYGYDCIFCGNKPDSCLSILYAIDSSQ